MQDYIEAIRDSDIVRFCYIVKTVCMDLDSENLVHERQKKLQYILNLKCASRADFVSYADKLVKCYTEYKEMCEHSIVPIDSEQQFINSISEKVNTITAFNSITTQWLLNKSRPSTVADVIGFLMEADRRLPAEKVQEPPIKKQKTNEKKDEEVTLHTLLTAIKSGKNEKSGKRSSSTNEGNPKNSNSEPCRFFAKGTCKRGNDCPWSHSTDNNNSNSSSKPSTSFLIGDRDRLCHFVLDKGYCIKGDDCRYAATHWDAYKTRLSKDDSH